MNYRDFLLESREYTHLGTAQECMAYLENRCSISWNAFKTDGLCLYRGVSNRNKIKDWSLLQVETSAHRYPTGHNYLVSEHWNSLCDNRKYFDRSQSVMFTTNIEIANRFGESCNVFLRDSTRVNATVNDFNESRLNDIFTIKNPGKWDINGVEVELFRFVQNICKDIIPGGRMVFNVLNSFQNDVLMGKIDPKTYYNSIINFFIELSCTIKTIDGYIGLIPDALPRSILEFFKDNNIDWSDINKIWDLMKINRKGVESLDVRDLYMSNTVYAEIWTSSDIVLVTEAGMKKLRDEL